MIGTPFENRNRSMMIRLSFLTNVTAFSGRRCPRCDTFPTLTSKCDEFQRSWKYTDDAVHRSECGRAGRQLAGADAAWRNDQRPRARLCRSAESECGRDSLSDWLSKRP